MADAEIEVEIQGIRMSLITKHRVIILRDLNQPDRFLPIWIGAYEADMIAVKIQNVPVSRPMSHDLMLELIKAGGLKVQKIVITALEGETFFATLVVEKDGQLIEVDARPSDAFALAVRAEAPIFVKEAVMEASSVLASSFKREETTELNPPVQTNQAESSPEPPDALTEQDEG